jgi:hypothetical protein
LRYDLVSNLAEDRVRRNVDGLYALGENGRKAETKVLVGEICDKIREPRPLQETASREVDWSGEIAVQADFLCDFATMKTIGYRQKWTSGAGERVEQAVRVDEIITGGRRQCQVGARPIV